MSSITLSLRGGKEARALLDSLSGRELQNRTRRATRAGAAVFRREVRAQAKSRGDIPDSFAKTDTQSHRSPISTSTGPSSPLHRIFEGGAGVHSIGEGQVLSGAGGEHFRNAPFFARGTVSHPGMRARPLTIPIFGQKNEEAGEAAMDEMLEGIR